jgi:ketosteroid isomerase-like protein
VSSDAERAASASIEDRLRRVEDRLEIYDIGLRYFLAIDEQDIEALRDLYAEDAVSGGAVGREAVLDVLREARPILGATIHTLDFSRVELQGDSRASAIIRAHVEMDQGGTTAVGAMEYYDTYIRTDHGWRIAERTMCFFYACPWRDIATSLTAEMRVRRPGEEPQHAMLQRFLTPAEAGQAGPG